MNLLLPMRAFSAKLMAQRRAHARGAEVFSPFAGTVHSGDAIAPESGRTEPGGPRPASSENKPALQCGVGVITVVDKIAR
jgi:hypothetical protein